MPGRRAIAIMREHEAAMADRSAHPVEWLRGVALSLERLAVQGFAGGAVRGATDELRAGVPDELHDKVAALLRDALTILERLAEDAARSRASPIDAWSHAAADGAVRGAIEAARRLVPDMEPTTRELLGRVRRWLDRSAAEAEERAQVIRAPGDRARIAAAGAVAGATEQLGAALPGLAEPAAEFAAHVGRGLVRGAAEEVASRLEAAARLPAVRTVLAGSALAVGGVIVAALLRVKRR
jgi:hypothetical protein